MASKTATDSASKSAPNTSGLGAYTHSDGGLYKTPENTGTAQSISQGGGGGGGDLYYDPSTGQPAPAPQTVDPNIALRQAAYDRAIAYGNQQITDRSLNQGLVDQYGLLNAYKALIDQRRLDLGNGGTNYDEYGAQSYFDNALGTAESRYRNDLTNSIRGVATDGFENQWFADTADDPLLQAILDAQKSDAQLVLDRAKARGQLNDVGYTRAANDLATQGSGGMSQLQSLGGGVLADYRKQLLTARDNGLNSAGTASFSSPFNAGSIVDRLNSLKTDLSGRLEGDINKAVGGTSFYTPNTAIGKGGTVQGTVNPSRINFKENPLLEAFQTDSARKTYGNNSGSLASTGAF